VGQPLFKAVPIPGSPPSDRAASKFEPLPPNSAVRGRLEAKPLAEAHGEQLGRGLATTSRARSTSRAGSTDAVKLSDCGLKRCAFDAVTTALGTWARLRSREGCGNGLDRWASIAQAKERVRSDRIGVRPLHRLWVVLPSIDGCAHNTQSLSKLFLSVTDQLAEVAYLDRIELLQLQDADGEQECNLIQDATVHVDAAAFRANKRRHVVHDNSFHVEERTNIMIDELLNEAPLTA
jgi:hypothetical protein